MIRSPLLILAATASLLAGCGSSSHGSPSGSGSATATGVSRSAFIQKADALCRSTHQRQAQLQRQARGRPLSKLPPILRTQATIAENLAAQLRSLQAPAGDQLPVARFVAAVRQLGVLSVAAANSIQARHARAIEGLKVKLNVARQQETSLGQGYGFKVCASGMSF